MIKIDLHTEERSLEQTDDFEKEVEKLGNSGKFMAFLEERSMEKEAVPIEEVAKNWK